MATTQTPKAKQPKNRTAAEIVKKQKLLALREQIIRDEQTITALEECRSALAKTDVVGLSVAHKTFGMGIIVEQLPLSITVKFDFGCKRFIMPSAFADGFLTTADPEIHDKFTQYHVLGKKIKLTRDHMSIAASSIQRLEKK